jgi:hypothetical protein
MGEQEGRESKRGSLGVGRRLSWCRWLVQRGCGVLCGAAGRGQRGGRHLRILAGARPTHSPPHTLQGTQGTHPAFHFCSGQQPGNMHKQEALCSKTALRSPLRHVVPNKCGSTVQQVQSTKMDGGKRLTSNAHRCLVAILRAAIAAWQVQLLFWFLHTNTAGTVDLPFLCLAVCSSHSCCQIKTIKPCVYLLLCSSIAV